MKLQLRKSGTDGTMIEVVQTRTHSGLHVNTLQAVVQEDMFLGHEFYDRLGDGETISVVLVETN